MNEVFFKEIREGSFNEVKAMLEKNPILVNSKDVRGSTPLILATYYDEMEITKLLFILIKEFWSLNLKKIIFLL